MDSKAVGHEDGDFLLPLGVVEVGVEVATVGVVEVRVVVVVVGFVGVRVVVVVVGFVEVWVVLVAVGVGALDSGTGVGVLEIESSWLLSFGLSVGGLRISALSSSSLVTEHKIKAM